MSMRVIGAILIVIGCGYFGWSIPASVKREEASLRELVSALDYMQCELQYHMTPLPDLCREAGIQCSKNLGSFFRHLSEELENRLSPDVSGCVSAALTCVPGLPKRTVAALEILGMTLGRFDVQGQILELESLRNHCRAEIDEIGRNRDSRLRSYQTLGICMGAALAILFV